MNNKKRNITALILAIAILVLLNFVGSFIFHRFDLTSEKRYTLSDATKKLLNNLNDVVYVKVYMGKNETFPAGFKHLRNQTQEMLDEFRAYSNNNIEYEFINPNESTDKKQQEELFKQLYEKGLQPTNLEIKNENTSSQQVIWPAALVTFNGKEMPWQLLKTQLGQSSEMQLNNSIQALEYEFASCIHNLSSHVRPQIAFIDGHGELDTLSLNDIASSLSEFYSVKRLTIQGQANALQGLKAIIIAKPDTAFSEKDKYIIDQFVMNGGKVLWLIDQLYTSVDSLRKSGGTIAASVDMNIENQLFKYGVRINPNLIVDMQSSAIPVNTAFAGQEPHFELKPWWFSPLIMPIGNHPIVKNLEVIKLDFVSSIDTVSAKGIKKTILLQTSKYSKALKAPVRIDLRMATLRPDENIFTDSYQSVAILLEGQFESVFKNRMLPQFIQKKTLPYKDESVNTQMIVISDGDIIRNEIQYSTKKPYPLGYDKYTNQTYGNKNFILNCINYLCDDSGLISVRARELTLRLLDKKKILNERLKWQLINILMPLILIFIFGFVYHFVRIQKYTK
jgi:ABC-2 type transport system permease protein